MEVKGGWSPAPSHAALPHMSASAGPRASGWSHPVGPLPSDTSDSRHIADRITGPGAPMPTNDGAAPERKRQHPPTGPST